ncbi:arginine--tRNA ligase [Acidipropionibacterium thoenii]|uniref:arginine--tRNA ligase n=1 Tax=Acidipropionibacterium thoenii TaxID=1751 RepID=UPI0004073461|nr:arginine--tRNA ligase [Acidipropionibacterium thoenii]
MSSLPSQLAARIESVTGVDPELRPATKPQFGHFQSNVALRLAKSQGRPPREVAADIVSRLDAADLVETPEIAGPGFINFRLRTDLLAQVASELVADPHAGIAQATHPQRVVIDYSAPNVAKQMHVGHLRSTIIGDCFNRVLSAQGHTVIPQNHIGDWGTQFGMLVQYIVEHQVDVSALDLAETEQLYKDSKRAFDADTEFADRARKRVVMLQSGDPQTRSIWTSLITVSLAGFNETYARLGVLLTDDDLAGESTYNDDLPRVVDELEADGLAREDDGALCVFVKGEDSPMIVRKKDGGFGYDATDLAAIRHRVGDLRANRIIYVTDVRQHHHFVMVFTVARMAGFLPDDVSAEHVGYGMVLGPDGHPFKTRDGGTVSLASLLDEAEEHAAPNIALAAIKYADLSNGLQKDYVFDAERMVETTGDTGPYLQYAHARVSQILRRAAAEADPAVDPEADLAELDWGTVTVLGEPAEQQLALLLSRFGETVELVAHDLTPHKLCTYLYELAGSYSSFYEKCPVLKSEGAVRSSRLALCAATRRVLGTGLNLLGIDAPDRM